MAADGLGPPGADGVGVAAAMVGFDGPGVSHSLIPVTAGREPHMLLVL